MQKAINMGDFIEKCNYSVMSPVFFHFTYSRSEAGLDKIIFSQGRCCQLNRISVQLNMENTAHRPSPQ